MQTFTPAPPPPRSTQPATTSRDIALLPRHWAWLADQPRSASAALRQLIDEARRDPDGRHQLRAAQDACYRVLRGQAGDLVGYEDALRAVYAVDAPRFEAACASWPAPVREAAMTAASSVWPTPDARRTA
ncbi:MAG: hypothetical protein RLZZ618_2610 [Pseudomonadota bacterium]|jgi:hypothetical protein